MMSIQMRAEHKQELFAYMVAEAARIVRQFPLVTDDKRDEWLLQQAGEVVNSRLHLASAHVLYFYMGMFINHQLHEGGKA